MGFPKPPGPAGEPAPATRRRAVQVLVVLAVACVLLGAVVVGLGPVRWSRDRTDAARRREGAATLATCLQFRSLADREAAGALPAAELRTRVGELYLAAEAARVDVRRAVADLQDAVVATGATALPPAADALRAACDRP